jgi:predicted nucleic acid-binding protein
MTFPFGGCLDMIFCDTSTLAKYYVPEVDTPRVQVKLDAEDRVYLSDLARTEVMAVFHRRLREKKWSRSDFQAAVRQFAKDDLAGFWAWAPLDGDVTREAAKVFSTLPDSVFLRAADCLHLVTALRHGFTEIHTHDEHQRKGAAAVGLTPITIR